jgi:hypothetical protein
MVDMASSRRLTPCIALESSIFAFGSACCSPAFSAVFLPTKRLFGSFCAATGSCDIPSSTSGPKFVAALSSSMLRVVSLTALRGCRELEIYRGAKRESWTEASVAQGPHPFTP